MSEPTDANRTAAETALFDWFAAEAESRSAEGAIAAQRTEAFDRFSGQGLPHRRVEAYKYTDLRATLRTLPPAADNPDREAVEAAVVRVPALADTETAPVRLVIANGRFVAEASDLAALDGAVSVTGFADLLGATDPRLERIGSLAAEVDDPMLALNTALFEGGVVIEVAAGASVARAIEILHVVTSDEAVTTMPRHAVFVGEGASVSFLERHEGWGEAANVTNVAIELCVAPRARVTWAKLQAETTASTHVGTTTVAVGETARLNHLTVTLGARLSRSQVFAKIDGEDTETSFDTATFVTGQQHADATLVLDHKVPNGVSRERFRSVVDDKAKAIVQGRINVWQHAQKTDAQMMSNALLLSDEAEAVNKPELEIFADDVQCAHGATSGQIDENALFYLRSRGVPKHQAERLLIESFLIEAVEGLGDEAVSPALAARIRAALHAE